MCRDRPAKGGRSGVAKYFLSSSLEQTSEEMQKLSVEKILPGMRDMTTK
jgi:hypothetical protein